MLEDLRVAELLCTRLCHDLTGPIGAVNNGAEFLGEEGFSMQGQAVELITSSAFSAVTRLQFYRFAYGYAKDHGEANLADRQKLAMDFFADGKVTLDWPDSHTDSAGVSISIKMARLIYNLLIIASSLLIRGGTVSVRIGQDPSGHKQVEVSAKGAGLKWEPEIEQIFSGAFQTGNLTPKNVQVYLTKRYCDDLRAAFTYHVGDEELTIRVVQAGNS
jgi:histidine phosphotransferase ChpT